MKILYSVLLCSLLVSNLTLEAQSNPKLLLIGIDGCRPDALQAASTPAIDALIANGTYSFESLTEAQTWSGVGWSAMLTGVYRAKHGVSDNSFNGSNYGSYPHFYSHLNTCSPGLVTASVAHWNPINTQILNSTPTDFVTNTTTDLAVKDQGVTYLANNDLDVLFLDFDDVDHAGHAHGFNTSVPQYIDAIELTDTYVGEIIAALENRPNYATENWLVIVTTDHGGTPSGHGGSSIGERIVYTIFSGDAVTNEQKTKATTDLTLSHALFLDDTDEYIDIPDNTAYDFGSTQDFTIECRVKLNSVSGDPVILSDKNWASGSNAGFAFSFPSNSSAWKVNIGDGSDRLDITGDVINDGAWHHLAVSFDRDGMMKMYQDGSFVKSESMANIGNIDTPYPFIIGQDGTENYGSSLDGAVTEVRLWNTVIDEATLVKYACTELVTFHPDFANLIGYWPLNEGSGTTATDASNTANNGTIVGASPVWTASPGILTCNDYSQTMRLPDVAASALQYMCGGIESAWNLDGTPIAFNAILPAELTAFSAKATGCDVQINWTVATQSNNEKFVLERSYTAKNFTAIRTLPGAGTTDVSQTYQVDDQLLSTTTYYRLRQIDFDGTETLSKIISVVSNCGAADELAIFPNPVSQQLNLRFTASKEETASWVISDIHGRIIDTATLEVQQGTNTFAKDIRNLPAGAYFIRLHIGTQSTRIQRFVKT